MTTLQQLAPGQSSPEVPVNENFETLSGLAVYGKRQPVTTGLTWGYYGGRWSGASVADGTLTLTNNATNYIVVENATGTISVATTTTNWNNDTDYSRVYKVTTASGVVSAVEDHRVGAPGIFGGSAGGGGGGVARFDQVAVSDEATAITTGTNKIRWRKVGADTLAGVRASLGDAQTSGSIFTIDINKNGTTVLSTKLTIDNNEKTSTTAATPAVISATAGVADFADDDEVEIDVDQVGNGTAKGLKVVLEWA